MPIFIPLPAPYPLMVANTLSGSSVFGSAVNAGVQFLTPVASNPSMPKRKSNS